MRYATVVAILAVNLLGVGCTEAPAKKEKAPAELVELKYDTDINEDREALFGDGKSAWEFEKWGPRVQLYFAKGLAGKPDRGRISYLTGPKELESSMSFEFDFKLEERDGKRHIKVNEGPPLPLDNPLVLMGGAKRFDTKGSDPVLVYKLEGDKLHLFSGKHGDLDLTGVWKRVALKSKGG
jgi:hypothetical protein